ncbi:MAG: hypothetical protein ACTHLP_07080 [Rhizobiaceae bacterium]
MLLGLAALVRGSDFVSTGKFDSDKYNADLDRLTRADREQRRDIDRAVRVGCGDASLSMPTQAANKLIGWDAAGEKLEDKDAAGIRRDPLAGRNCRR